MDSNQVRTRILEVGQLVKQALLERGIAATEKVSNYKYVEGVARPRNSPFWSEERGFKYIDDVDDHLRRLAQCLELLDPRPGSSVFEIGPGNCYFLFMCRELRGCRVAGIDWKYDEASVAKIARLMPYHELKKYAYHLFRTHFGLEEVIQHQVVEGGKPIAFGGRYDAIVATRAMFNHGWGEAEYRYWLRDCYEHLNPEGRLLIHFNKVDPAKLTAFPFLRPQNPSPGNEKVSVVPRTTIGQAIGEI